MVTQAHNNGYRPRYQEVVGEYGRAILEVVSETLWPTRCAICDLPGELLCENCRLTLPFVDFLRACPRCGAPFGSIQCSECNPVALKALKRSELPFSACVCTTVFSKGAARLITTYKDRGEQRLGNIIASLMANTIPPAWSFELDAIIAIPARGAAIRRRGFDHTEKISENLSAAMQIPLLEVFERPRSKDQRSLSKRDRANNMAHQFLIPDAAKVPQSVLLIDDVFTTGSTLCAASDTLHQAGAQDIRCATFARVW
ncbi:MAG: phosphoribosyltransferase family protein [Raoultibacter sp.]